MANVLFRDRGICICLGLMRNSFYNVEVNFCHLDIFRRDDSHGKFHQHKISHSKCQLPMHTSVHLSSTSALKLVFFFFSLKKELGIEVVA